MAHISSLQSGIYTYLDIYDGSVVGMDTVAEFVTAFATANSADITRLPSVREFPSIGTPANIVNVPVYGQATSSQVQGQSDAPSLELTVNYVAEDMLPIYALVGQEVAFRVLMVGESVSLTNSINGTALQTINNTEFYFIGRVEAILVNPQLTDATTATVTLSAQSDFYGPATISA